MYEDFENDGSEDHSTARFAYHVDKQFNDKVSLFHNLEYLPNVEDLSNFNLNADAGVKAMLTDKMYAV